MASLSETRIVLRNTSVFSFLKKVWFEIGDDNLFTWASALAYSWLFAVFPFFLVLLAIVPFLRPTWKHEAYRQVELTLHQLPREAEITLRQYVEPKFRALLYQPPRGITGIFSIGLVITIWCASSGMAMTMAAMDRCYDVERMRPYYKQRPLAVLLTIIVTILLLAVVVLVPIGTYLTEHVLTGTETLLVKTHVANQRILERPHHEHSSTRYSSTAPATSSARSSTEPSSQPATGAATRPLEHQLHRLTAYYVIWQFTRYLISLMFLFWVVSLIFHFGPNVKQHFHLLSPGSVFTIGTWAVLAYAFRYYVDTFGKYGQTYGAVGGVVILLFFFYLAALVLLVGAEINSEVDAAMRKLGHHRQKPPPPSETQNTQPAVDTP